MKKVLYTIESVKNLHSLWKNFIFNPPKGYKYYDLSRNIIKKQETKATKSMDGASKGRGFPFDLMTEIVSKSLNYPIINQAAIFLRSKTLGKRVTALKPDIIYSDNGKFLDTDIPWVVDAENVGVFTLNYNYHGILTKYYRNYIERVLANDSCKKILPYSEASRKSINASLNCEKFTDKIITVPNIVKYKESIKKIPHDGFNILFTGSHQNVDEFWNRGGREVVLSFLEISKKNPKIKLILRSAVPTKIKRQIQSNKNIEIYESPLPFEDFQNLFLKSDVYLFPAYTGYAISILDAMNYGLPIITTDFLENGEKVENGYNGYKIPLGINTPQFYLPFVPIHFVPKNRPPIDRNFINSIVEKIQYLFDNESEKINMGKNSRKKLKEEFSLEKKNQMLKKIFDNI